MRGGHARRARAGPVLCSQARPYGSEFGPARGGSAGLSDRAPTVSGVTLIRQCSRTACVRPATSTLTYVYAEQTAVLGPLATFAEPHSYDLCEEHATRLTAPRGWDIVRLELPEGEPRPPVDDLAALADAVREHRGVARTDQSSRGSAEQEQGATVTEIARRGHLRVLRDS